MEPLNSVPDKKSEAKACCWSSECGHTSPCGSGCDAAVCSPEVSLLPAAATQMTGCYFTRLGDHADVFILMTQGYQNHTNMLAYTLHKYNRHCQNIHSCTEGSVAQKKDAHRHTTVLSPAKFPPKADIPVLHNQQSAVFAMCCSVPLSVSTAASAGCELLTL